MTYDLSNVHIPEYHINYDEFEKISSKGSLSRDPEKTTTKIKICTWNVNGIRSNILRPCNCAELKLNTSVVKTFSSSVGLGRLIDEYSPDIFCLQETRSPVSYLNNIQVEGWDIYASESHSTKDARKANKYSGTAIFVNREKIGKPLEVIDQLPGLSLKDDEGRLIALKFKVPDKEESFWIVNVYTPNSGTNLKFRNDVWGVLIPKFLDSLENVIYCGDMNIARTLHDITYKEYPELTLEQIDADLTKQKVVNFRADERKWFDHLLDKGFVDVWRKFHLDSSVKGYTHIDNLRRGIKMRIDYFLAKITIPYEIQSCEVEAYHRTESDHIPLIMEIKV